MYCKEVMTMATKFDIVKVTRTMKWKDRMKIRTGCTLDTPNGLEDEIIFRITLKLRQWRN